MKKTFQRKLLSVAIASLTVSSVSAYAADTGGVEEVVITAQKRTEKLKDVAVSAQVMSSDALTKSNATDISDLNKLVPSVQLKGSINGRVPLAMRGISTSADQSTYGLTSGVAILIDGIPTSADSMSANQLNDVQRVEVLKGPQSTLGGRTASSGVINIVTRKPSKTFSSSVSLMATDDDQIRGEAFLTGPISDTVAYSLSAFQDHTKYPMKNLANGKNTTTDSDGIRAKLLISPTENLDINLVARYSDFKSKGSNFVYQYATPGAKLFNTYSVADAMPGVTPYFGNTNYNSRNMSHSYVKDNDLSMNIDYRIGDHTFSSTTARQHETQDVLQDLFVISPLEQYLTIVPGVFAIPLSNASLYGSSFNNQMTHRIDITTTSQEFKLASPLGGPVSYVTGLFYSDTQIKADDFRPFTIFSQIRSVNSDTKSLGLYGRVTWNIADKTDLVTGLRWNRDTISYAIDQKFGGDNTAGNANAYASSASSSSNTAVGDLSLQYHLSKDDMVYVTVAKGYKPSVYNTSATLESNTALVPVDPEKITHFEIGSKGTYLNNKLSVNLAVFDTVYKNYQIQVHDTQSLAMKLQLNNAGEAETRGIEADFNYKVDPSLRLTLNAAYIDAKFNKYKDVECYPTQVAGCTYSMASGSLVGIQDASGAVMPGSPKFKMTLGAQKQIDLDALPFDLTLSGNYAYRSKEQYVGDQNPLTIQKAFGILNLSATATSKTGQYAVTFFINNVTDKYYSTDIEDFWSGPWSAVQAPNNVILAQPARDSHRYAGVRFNLDF